MANGDKLTDEQVADRQELKQLRDSGQLADLDAGELAEIDSLIATLPTPKLEPLSEQKVADIKELQQLRESGQLTDLSADELTEIDSLISTLPAQEVTPEPGSAEELRAQPLTPPGLMEGLRKASEDFSKLSIGQIMEGVGRATGVVGGIEGAIALGEAPIQAALGATEAIVEGGNPLTAALEAGGKAFQPGVFGTTFDVETPKIKAASTTLEKIGVPAGPAIEAFGTEISVRDVVGFSLEVVGGATIGVKLEKSLGKLAKKSVSELTPDEVTTVRRVINTNTIDVPDAVITNNADQLSSSVNQGVKKVTRETYIDKKTNERILLKEGDDLAKAVEEERIRVFNNTMKADPPNPKEFVSRVQVVDNKGNVRRSFSKDQKRMFAIAKSKKVDGDALELAFKEGQGVDDFRFTGEDAITQEQILTMEKRLKKITKGMTPEEKAVILRTGNEVDVSFKGIGESLREVSSSVKEAWTRMRFNAFGTMDGMARTFGESGVEFAERVLNMRKFTDSNLSKDLTEIRNLDSSLKAGGKDWRNVVESLENPEAIGKLTAKQLQLREGLEKLTTKYANFKEQIGLQTVNSSGNKIGITRLDNYFPHSFTSDFMGTTKKRKKIIKSIMQKEGVDEAGAVAKLNEMMEWSKNRKDPHLERERLFNVDGWLGDPKSFVDTRRGNKRYKNDVLLGIEQYLEGANRRFGEHIYLEDGGKAVFGPEFRTGDELIKSIPDGPSQQMLGEMKSRIMGLENDASLAVVASTMKNIQVLEKLGFSSIANSMQSLITTVPKAAALGYVRGTKIIAGAIKEMVVNNGNDAARRSGVAIQQSIRDISGLSGKGISSKSANALLQLNGFSKIEQANRLFAANVGKQYFDHAVDIVAHPDRVWAKATGKLKQAEIDLKNLGLTKEKIAKIKAGDVSVVIESDVENAMWRFSRMTQFSARPEDLPYWASHPMGSLLFQFKSFAINQAKFMGEHVLKPAKRGNLAPLMTFLATSQIAGEGIIGAKNLLKGKDQREDNGMERILNNWSAAASLGIFSDVWKAASYGKTIDLLAGPTLGTAVDEVENSIKLIDRMLDESQDVSVGDEVEKFLRRRTRNIPGAEALTRPAPEF